MTRTIVTTATRQDLLAGISPLILAIAMLPGTAAAQASATGQTALAIVQRTLNSPIRASRTDPAISIRADDVTDTAINATDTIVDIRAGANASTTDLATGPGAPAGANAHGTIGDGAVTADAGLVLSSEQRVTGGTVSGTIAGGTSVSLGRLTAGNATIARDQSAATSFGNANSGTVRNEGGSSAALASGQSVLAAPISSVLTGRLAIVADAVDTGRVILGANSQRAVATGNTSDLGLAAMLGGTVSGGGARATRLLGDEASGEAAQLLLQRQFASGPIGAQAGTQSAPAGSSASVASLTKAAVALTGNSLESDAAGNRATAAVDLTGTGVAGEGSIAGSLIAQSALADVAATSAGGSRASIGTTLKDAALTLADNRVATTARGNVANNAMRVTAAVIGPAQPISSPPGSALIDATGAPTTSGGFVVHTDQIAGGVSIAAMQLGDQAIASVAGPVTGSRLTLATNLATADAAANTASSALSLQAPVFASSAALLTVQSSDATVQARLGEDDLRAGATIAPAGGSNGASFSILGNALRADAIGNRAKSTLALDSASGADSGTSPRSSAGPLDGGGYGAAARLALSSTQKVGDPARPTAAIDAQILGRYSVTGDGGARGSSVAIVGNQQAASAGGNSAENSLALTATPSINAGTALSNAQFAQARLTATSSLRAIAPGALDASQVSISDNSNAATATLNDANNRLSGTGGAVVSDDPAIITADLLANASARGSHVLSNTQFASGTTAADARSVVAASPGTIQLTRPGIERSSVSLSNNSTSAQANGNRALNAIAVGGDANGAIASSQMNVASVASRAQATVGFAIATQDAAITDGVLDVTGNSGTALSRGNVAENRINIASSPGATAPVSGIAEIASASLTAQAPIAIVNAQMNYGPINAVASIRAGLPLNQTLLPVDMSRATIGANAITATAYGNGASNVVTIAPGPQSAISLASTQRNVAPISAIASGGPLGITLESVRGSTLGITGNTISAAAFGNVVTNTIAMTH